TDCILSNTLGEIVGETLGVGAGIDEDQRGAMLRNQFDETIVDVVPHLVRRDRAEFAFRNLDGEIHLALVSYIDDDGRRATFVHTGQEFSDKLDWFLRGGEANANRLRVRENLKALERESKM